MASTVTFQGTGPNAKAETFTVGDLVAITRTSYSGEDRNKPVQYKVTTVKTITPKGMIRTEDGHLWKWEYSRVYGAESNLRSDWLTHITPEEAKALEEHEAAKKAAESAAKHAKLEKQEADRRAYEQKRRNDALAANPDVQFTSLGTLGNDRLYSAYIINEDGRMCFVVLICRRVVDIFSRSDERKMVWAASLNYAENRPDYSSPVSMGSRSPDVKAETLEDLFTNAIVRAW